MFFFCQDCCILCDDLMEAVHHVLITAVIHAVNWHVIRILREWSSACSKCSLLQQIVCVSCVTNVSVHMPCRCCQLVQLYLTTFCRVARSKEEIWRWWCVRHGFLVTHCFYNSAVFYLYSCYPSYNTLSLLLIQHFEMYDDDISYLFEDCCKLGWTSFITYVTKSLLVL